MEQRSCAKTGDVSPKPESPMSMGSTIPELLICTFLARFLVSSLRAAYVHSSPGGSGGDLFAKLHLGPLHPWHP